MTPRQNYILSAIVETYATTAEPVSSQQLTEKIEVSSATIRGEMAELEKLGLIRQPHTSAGRVPTDRGYRLYVNSIKTLQPENRASHALARRIATAGEADLAIRGAAESLADATGNLGLATVSKGWFFSGLKNIFSQPEFAGAQAFEVARLLDNLDEWLSEAAPGEKVSVYIGRENPVGKSSGASLIVARFISPYSDHSYIGVMGPTRQNYGRVMGLVDYAGRYLEESLA
jgi:heat-inducible transcriptional repressor